MVDERTRYHRHPPGGVAVRSAINSKFCRKGLAPFCHLLYELYRHITTTGKPECSRGTGGREWGAYAGLTQAFRSRLGLFAFVVEADLHLTAAQELNLRSPNLYQRKMTDTRHIASSDCRNVRSQRRPRPNQITRLGLRRSRSGAPGSPGVATGTNRRSELT